VEVRRRAGQKLIGEWALDATHLDDLQQKGCGGRLHPPFARWLRNVVQAFGRAGPGGSTPIVCSILFRQSVDSSSEMACAFRNAARMVTKDDTTPDR
jgi:hypothetical protein